MTTAEPLEGRAGTGGLQLFGLASGRPFAEAVSARLAWPLSAIEERSFEDGEHKVRPLESVRDADAYVVHGLDGVVDESVNDRLCRLLFFIATLRDHGAARITLACPYLGYARKDRRTKPRDPVTTRYVAQLLESMGLDCVIALEVHNPAAFENAFRVPTLHLEASMPLAAALIDEIEPGAPVAVVSPDTGGAKRAAALRDTLAERTGMEIPLAFLEKHRSEGVVSGDTVAGDVAGRTAVIVDDLIASGTTLLRAVQACRERGANRVIAAAAHGMFAVGADRLFGEAGPDRLLVTDSVAPRHQAEWGVRVVPVAESFARVIAALHRGSSTHAALAAE